MLSSACSTVRPLRIIGGAMGPAMLAANVTTAARAGRSCGVAAGGAGASAAGSTARRHHPTAAAAAAAGSTGAGRMGRVVHANATTTGAAANSLSARAALAGRRSKRLTAPNTNTVTNNANNSANNRRSFPSSVTRAVATGGGDRGSNKIKLTGDAPPRPFFDSKEANDVSGYVNFASRDELKEAAMLDRHSIPTPPISQTYQQTLRRSFTLLGIGLHSGEVETVRVCPAFAGEGRYFVRVPVGTIPADAADEDAGGAFSRKNLTSEETEDMVLEQLRSMMSNADESKDGTAQRAAELKRKEEKKQEFPGDFISSSDEHRIPASLALVQDDLRLSTRLELDGVGTEVGFVGTVEHLLSALEASGVDNARVEVEGSGEIPILDGSAYQFCYESARVGLVPADSKDGGAGSAARMAWASALDLSLSPTKCKTP